MAKKFVKMLFWDFLLLFVSLMIAIFSRIKKPKKIDVGLGPIPLINNIYHKQAIAHYGYTVETFAFNPYFITSNFDIVMRSTNHLSFVIYTIKSIYLCLCRYKVLIGYMNGFLFSSTQFAWRFEPFFMRLANVKTVLMPFGSDVQELSKSTNLLFKHTMASDYPAHRFDRVKIEKRIDVWTKYADHIISGCEWVDYMYFWHTLMIAHFSIDLAGIREKALRSKRDNPIHEQNDTSYTLKVLHAPNHRSIKGTAHLIAAIESLQSEGVNIELQLLEHVSNEKIIAAIANADVIVDQLIIGWYAMFAIEAMACGKPVICNVRPDLTDLYISAGLLAEDELPLIHATPRTIKEVLRRLASMTNIELRAIGDNSYHYAQRHHSTHAVGEVFDKILNNLGIASSSISEKQT